MKTTTKLISAVILLTSSLQAQDAKDPQKQEKPAKIIGETNEQDITYYDEEKTKIKIQTSYYMKDGKKISHGPSKAFFANGKLATEKNYVDGFIDGNEIHYNQNGEKEFMIVWSKGDLLKQKKFNNSVLISEVEVKTIKVKSTDANQPDSTKYIKNGVEIKYYSDGKIQQKTHWKDDIKNGLETFYFNNGKKKRELTWKNKTKDGIETQWYENEKVSIIINWAENLEHGEMLNYHENGQKKDQIIFDKGKIINERLSWNDEGVIIGQCTYKDGKPFKGTLLDIENLLLLTFENGSQISSKVCDRSGKLKQ